MKNIYTKEFATYNKFIDSDINKWLQQEKLDADKLIDIKYSTYSDRDRNVAHDALVIYSKKDEHDED